MNDRFAYIGRKPCGCVMAVVTDFGDSTTARHVMEFIESGLTVQRVSWDEYRDIAEEDTFLNYPHGQLKLPLVAIREELE